jgi:hypothetical protein
VRLLIWGINLAIAKFETNWSGVFNPAPSGNKLTPTSLKIYSLALQIANFLHARFARGQSAEQNALICKFDELASSSTWCVVLMCWWCWSAIGWILYGDACVDIEVLWCVVLFDVYSCFNYLVRAFVWTSKTNCLLFELNLFSMALLLEIGEKSTIVWSRTFNIYHQLGNWIILLIFDHWVHSTTVRLVSHSCTLPTW